MTKLHTPTSDIRPIHYLGSKLRLTTEICNSVEKMQPGVKPVLDLFSGSGTVSNTLSKYWDITACDIQEYSRVLCSALITPQLETYDISAILEKAKQETVRLFEEYSVILEFEDRALKKATKGNVDDLYTIIESGHLLPEYRMHENKTHLTDIKDLYINSEDLKSISKITLYYGGVYFSYRQALHLDALRNAIDSLFEDGKDLPVAALLSTASELVNSVGKQFAQPLKVRNSQSQWKYGLLKKILKDRETVVFPLFEKKVDEFILMKHPRPGNFVFRNDCFEFLESRKDKEYGVIYADPPYSRYHYSRYYHVLETIARNDNPAISNNPATKLPSKGVYRVDRFQSPFSTRTGAEPAFERLFSLCASKANSVILSYSDYPFDQPSTPRMITIDRLREMACEYFSNIEVIVPESIKHSKLNTADKNFAEVSDPEVLLLCKNAR